MVAKLSALKIRSIRLNTAWSLLTILAPMLSAFFCIPALIQALGAERFGWLSMIWVISSQAVVFDFGIGRALIHYLSKAGPDEQGDLLHTTSTFYLVLSLGVALIGLLGTELTFAYQWIETSPGIAREARLSLYILLVSLPVIFMMVRDVGALQARGDFLSVFLVRFPVGVLNFVLPLALAKSGHADLVSISLGLLLLKVISVVVLRGMRIAEYGRSGRYSRDALGKLVGYGSWAAVSTVCGAAVTYIDRFFIAYLVGTPALTVYTAGNEVISRVTLIAQSLGSVLFPRLSSETGERDSDAFHRSYAALFILQFGICFVLALIARPFLRWWVGNPIAVNAAKVTILLAPGVLVNSLSFLPFTLLQAKNRPRQVATLHLVEIPFFLITLYGLVTYFGLVGAALAWTLRVFVDAVILHRWAIPYMNIGRKRVIMWIGLWGLALGSFALPWLITW